MNKTQEISKKYHDRETDLKKSISETEKNLSDAERKLSEAKAAENEAIVAGDRSAYLKAKKAQYEASGAVELYRKRIDYIKDQPLITPDEMKEAIQTIQEEFSKEQDDARQKLLDLAEEMYRIAADLDQKGTEASQTMFFLHCDLGRNPSSPYTNPRAGHDGTVNFGMQPVRDGFYTKRRGELYHAEPKMNFK